MKAALLQLNVSDSPADNLAVTQAILAEAAQNGAGFILTPEVTNCISSSRERQIEVLQHEADDITLAGLRTSAKEHGVWVLIGSIAIKTDDLDGRFANRSYLIAPDGLIKARYDKIHMFDVTVSATETYRESARFRPGDRAVLGQTEFGTIGMTICYDVRFPELHRRLATAGAQILTVPSAFSPVTGAAHWHSLLRARAIETGCYVLAPAQCGAHPSSVGGPIRSTYGHSLAVDPWGEIMCDAGDTVGISYVTLDLDNVNKARQRVPALTHHAVIKGPFNE